MVRELVDLKTIAQRTHYSTKYLANTWSQVLIGLRPIKFNPRCRKILFYWDEVEQLLNKQK
jgi:hypothetical protein